MAGELRDTSKRKGRLPRWTYAKRVHQKARALRREVYRKHQRVEIGMILAGLATSAVVGASVQEFVIYSGVWLLCLWAILWVWSLVEAPAQLAESQAIRIKELERPDKKRVQEFKTAQGVLLKMENHLLDFLAAPESMTSKNTLAYLYEFLGHFDEAFNPSRTTGLMIEVGIERDKLHVAVQQNPRRVLERMIRAVQRYRLQYGRALKEES